MKMFSGVTSHYGGGFFHSFIGLLPLATSTAIPTAIFVLSGVLVTPSKERRVCFVFFALSLLFSAGGISMLRYQDGYLGFWLASAGGVVAGAVVGLAAALGVQRIRRPIQSAQHNAGSRPSSTDSPASETPSAPAPRG